jgi:hypothetical protein
MSGPIDLEGIIPFGKPMLPDDLTNPSVLRRTTEAGK